MYGNIWCTESALCVGDGAHCQLEEPTGTFHQLGLWHSFLGHKSPKPSHLELQDSHGSPRGPDKDSTLASMQAFPLVYPHCKIMHRPQDSTSVHLSPDGLIHRPDAPRSAWCRIGKLGLDDFNVPWYNLVKFFVVATNTMIMATPSGTAVKEGVYLGL